MRNTQLLIFGGIAIVLAGLFTTMSLQEIMAQQTNSTTTAQSNQTTRMGIPQINGSVNIEQRSNQLIRDSIQVPFATALETAQSEVGNGTAGISGSLGVVQGYLVYIIKVANFDADTIRTVIVDAGNGAVLYTSGDGPLHFGGVGGPGCGYGSGGEGKHHHKGFGNYGGNYDRDMTTDSGNSGGGGSQSSSSGGVVASPAIGV